MILLELFVYASIGLCVVGVIRKAYQYINTPMHLRWELYPVAHETPDKVAHGGSYFEDVDWWKHERKTSLIGELKGMLPEMIFVKALFEHNRKLWLRSFPFHFGLYFLIGFAGLIVLGAAMQLVGIQVGGGSAIGSLVYALTIVAGVPGMLMVLIGSAALLHRRLTDEELKNYTYFSHYFNLIFIFVTVLFAFIAWLGDPGFSNLRAFAIALLPFTANQSFGAIITLEVIFACLLIAYIPFTNLSHPIAKYFTYHEIRWEDEPNLPGGEIEKKLGEYLNWPVTWAAPHLQGEGKRTWASIATEEIKKNEKR